MALGNLLPDPAVGGREQDRDNLFSLFLFLLDRFLVVNYPANGTGFDFRSFFNDDRVAVLHIEIKSRDWSTDYDLGRMRRWDRFAQKADLKSGNLVGGVAVRCYPICPSYESMNVAPRFALQLIIVLIRLASNWYCTLDRHTSAAIAVSGTIVDGIPSCCSSKLVSLAPC